MAGMKMTHEAGARHIIAYLDSQLEVKQVEGTYEAQEENMIQYLQQIAELRTGFESFQIIQILREENVKAEYLSKLASALEDCRTRHITIQYLSKLRAPVLEEGCFPDNRWEAARHKARAIRFLL
ncbi:UNVERIFIED_CONTAM: hypothetical protein Slati_3090800 [Sesamum latifolium]|uniref:RNase H type-1 domain-containing protein n=1 Tax=Sesamum latifolium TaxID=2727402 RepID=A0AAW2UU52_9LAMI